ncbi:MAG TPA: glycosyltransferase family 4 protein [Chloroflexota bacterium]|nr:glycosyltransferase family 4 protein [Chloroflexota bacterium]
MAPLRLVLIAPFATYPKASTSARALPLARALAGRGHRVTVLVPPYDRPQEGGRVYQVGQAQVEALLVPGVAEHSPRQALLQPQLAARLVGRVRQLQPDLVHVFKPKAVSGLAQLLLWYGRRVTSWPRRSQAWPAVVLDTDDWEGFGGWNEYETYPWWQKLACDWQERWGLRHAHAVTVASRTLEAQAWSHRVPPARVSYLPNGLAPEDLPGWRGADPGRAREGLRLGQAPVLLLYTRFFEFAPERVVEVVERVRAAVHDAKLLVVGAGKYGQERRLQALAAGRRLQDAVVLAGWQEPEQLPGLLAAADVALFPADDNLANRAKCSVKLLQAMWLGLPVVADRVGQQAEYVQHGSSGWLSDPEDPQSMADAAVRLLRDRELARRLGEGARRRAATDFNWPHLAERAERAYLAALGSSA